MTFPKPHVRISAALVGENKAMNHCYLFYGANSYPVVFPTHIDPSTDDRSLARACLRYMGSRAGGHFSSMALNVRVTRKATHPNEIVHVSGNGWAVEWYPEWYQKELKEATTAGNFEALGKLFGGMTETQVPVVQLLSSAGFVTDDTLQSA